MFCVFVSQEGYYLNQGGLGLCDLDNSTIPKYCEFERFFEDDVSGALNISSYRIQILFIKAAALDAVLVHFRVMPPANTGVYEPDVAAVVGLLIQQVSDFNSTLYDGNVTIRVDPTWGVDGAYVFFCLLTWLMLACIKLFAFLDSENGANTCCQSIS